MRTQTIVDPAQVEVQHSLGIFGPRGLTLVRGQGAKVWDDQGNPYIDATGGYGVASVGHSHPALVSAVTTQAQRLISCPAFFTNDQRSSYLTRLASVLPPDLNRLFLCNSGTEAIEAALKFARFTTGRTGVVAAMRGFHGRTFGALSATWESHYREPFAPLLAGFEHVPFNNAVALERAVTDKVGAVLLEVVQGEGGVRPALAEFLQTARTLCSERGAMLILDEVQTGFGRTGRMFASTHFDVVPDMLCLAKGIAGGIPMGAVVAGSRVKQLTVGAHGSTFGGNPLACAAANAVLDIFETERLVDQSAIKGAYLKDRLQQIRSPKIREVRGLGLMLGIELRERVTPYLKAMQSAGVLALNAGPNVIRLLPPLVIETSELDTIADVIQAVLSV